MAADAQVTARLAQYVAAARPGSLPEPVRREAVRGFVNILGCMLGGARDNGVVIAETVLAPFEGQPQATVIGRGRRSDLLRAALLNCLSASAHTFDDTHAEAIVHPSGPIAATVLALAERDGLPGAAVLHAFALGVEVTCRLSKAISVAPANGSIAWSQTGIAGRIGAAVAAGSLLGFDAATLTAAIGIAAAEAGGIRVMHGSMSTAWMPAQAAESGLRAALLAQGGFTSSPVSLEGRYGLCEAFAWEPHYPALVEGLGSRFELMANTYKPYPCGIVIHPIVDACLKLRQDHGIEHQRIEAVRVRASKAALALCDRTSPKDALQAQVSLQHWAAAALVHGKARLAEGTDAQVTDPVIARLRQRVSATADAKVPPDCAAVAVVLTDGTAFGVTIKHCLGSKANPMSDRDLEAKFRDQAEGVLAPTAIGGVLERCWRIESLADAGAIPRAAAG